MKRTYVLAVCLGTLPVVTAAPALASQARGSKPVPASAPVSLVFRGAAPGSGGVAAPVSPAAVPFHSSTESGDLNEAEPPEHRMPALPDPANLERPLAPAGANETDDGGAPGASGFRRLSVAATAATNTRAARGTIAFGPSPVSRTSRRETDRPCRESAGAPSTPQIVRDIEAVNRRFLAVGGLIVLRYRTMSLTVSRCLPVAHPLPPTTSEASLTERVFAGSFPIRRVALLFVDFFWLTASAACTSI